MELIKIILFGHVILLLENIDCNPDRVYQVKLAKEITDKPASHEAKTYALEQLSPVDTNSLSEDERLKMCKEATISLERLEQVKVKLLEGGRTEPRKGYAIDVETNRRGATKAEFVQAFKCPTKPPIYLQVLERDEHEHAVHIVVKESELYFTSVDDMRYEIKFVKDISSELSTRGLNLLADRDYNAVDPDEFDEDQRLEMCRKALEMDQINYRNIKFLENRRCGSKKFYVIDVESGRRSIQTEVVQGFRCPTIPPVYLEIDGDTVWVIIKESELLPRYDDMSYQYELKVVKKIREVSVGSSREARASNVIKSAVDTDEFSERQRIRMCKKALKIVEFERTKIKFYEDEKTEPSKYYALHLETGKRNPDIEVVQAFKCPTEPPIYLHVDDQDDNGNPVWVIINDVESRPASDFMSFQIRIVKDITNVHSREISMSLGSFDSTSKELTGSVIDSLTDEQRRQICQNAIRMISGKNVRFFENIKTGVNKLYYLDSVSGKRSSKTEVVQAFKCPTDPAIYLQVKDWEYDGYFVIIIIRERDLASSGDDMCYQIKFVESVVEAISHSAKKFSITEYQVVDTDNMTEQQRRKMCKEALEIKELADRNIRFMERNKTEPKKFYALELPYRRHSTEPELAQAFKCPTDPPIYLQVLNWELDGYLVWVIVNEDEAVSDDNRSYATSSKSLKNVSRRDKGLEIYDSFEKNISYGHEGLTQKPKCYVLDVEITGGKGSEFLKSFKNPKNRPIQLEIRGGQDTNRIGLSVKNVSRLQQNEDQLSEIEGLNEMCYRMKFVNRITDTFSSQSRSFSIAETSSVDHFNEEERLQMCKKAIKTVPGRNVVFVDDEEVGDFQYYALDLYSRRLVTQPELVHAFKCPTAPAIYLEVIHDEGHKYTVWVIMENSKLLPLSSTIENQMSYHVKYVADINEATSHEVTSLIQEHYFINSDEFSESQRIEMCKGGIRMVPEKKIKFVDYSPTGKSQYYVLEPEENTSKYPGKPELVKAFKCPTIPPIYLQIEDDNHEDEGYLVWVIVKESRRVTFNSGAKPNYRLKIIEKIGDVSSHQAYEIREYPPPDHVPYDDEEREKMCQDALTVIRGKEFIQWLKDTPPGKEKFYAVETQFGHHLIPAFQCPTRPPIYLETITYRNGRFVWVIIERSEMPF